MQLLFIPRIRIRLIFTTNYRINFCSFAKEYKYAQKTISFALFSTASSKSIDPPEEIVFDKNYFVNQKAIRRVESLLEFDELRSSLLVEYANPTIVTKSNPVNPQQTISFIQIKRDPETGKPTQSPTSTIFERWFYPRLFEIARGNGTARQIMMTGNAGTGKSYFQHYYMYRLVSATVKDKGKPLPPDYEGSTDAPDVVVREFGTGLVTINFIKERVAYTHENIKTILRALDKKSNLHLIEPGGSSVFLGFERSSFMQTFKTNSFDKVKYAINEFHKNVEGVTMFMPVFDLWELLLIGEYFRETFGVINPTLLELYSEDNIRKRFKLYNGIIRSIFPVNETKEEDNVSKRNEAIKAGDQRLIDLSNLDDIGEVSSKLMVMQVPIEGPSQFIKKGELIFAGDDILPRLLKNAEEEGTIWKYYREIRKSLRRFDESVGDTDFPRTQYESLFVNAMRYGISCWELRQLSFACGKITISNRVIDDVSKLPSTTFKSEKTVEGAPFSYETMEPFVLYRPQNLNFPVADCLMKDKNGDVFLFNMKSGKSASATQVKLTEGAYSDVLKSLHMTKEIAKEHLVYVVVTLYSIADIWEKVKLAKDDMHFKYCAVLKPTSDYFSDGDLARVKLESSNILYI